ncbi:MAG: sugar ABC transporter substrate-binding protein, partial [Pseudaminobacter sp.]|nr:sugar ABC transporter substrate-binding protein [Pseudaminobacter sp.]
MKRRELLSLAALAAALLTTTAFMPADAFAQDKKYKIGFSQATTIEPWRAQFNKDIIAEAAKHADVE